MQLSFFLGQPSAIETGELFSSYELADGTLDSVERFGKASIGEVVERFEWLVECQKIAQGQGFFHWELDQAADIPSGRVRYPSGQSPLGAS